MTKASGAMLQNTTLNGDTVIANSTKAKAAISAAAAAFRERSIRTTLNYIERKKVPHAHCFESNRIDQYRHYGFTVTSRMGGDHWGHIKRFLNRGARATTVDVYDHISTVADRRFTSIKCTLEVELASIITSLYPTELFSAVHRRISRIALWKTHKLYLMVIKTC